MYEYLAFCSEDFLVRVQAQVMTRDDSTGGWVPMGGGGLSNVGLRKLVKANGEDYHNEYLIYGERIADKSVCHVFYLNNMWKMYSWQIMYFTS